MSTFITRFDASGTSTGIRLAVKDLIDMTGVITTAGSPAVLECAEPAVADAACLAGARAAGARIVGRTNLHELALGVTGINPWFGTPVNPLDRALVPGGSSSGSAVAVAAGDADVAYGSDTGGSIRIPAACCGIVGLKTTWGRISLEGVWPLAPSLDTVGPMAVNVAGVLAGMQLLEPGFDQMGERAVRVGRLRVDADPAINDAVDDALRATGWEVVDVALPGWAAATEATATILVAEAWAIDGALWTHSPDKVTDGVGTRLARGRDIAQSTLENARRTAAAWQAELASAFERVDLIATPTLTIFPPTIDDADHLLNARCTLPVNLAGVPALAIPVASRHRLPASLQLVGPAASEALLLMAGATVERSNAWCAAGTGMTG